jgi:hypothetical protein
MNRDTEMLTSCLTAEDEDLLDCYDPGEVAIDFARLIRECIDDELSSFERVLDRYVTENRTYYGEVSREIARFIHKCVIDPAFAAEVLMRLDPEGVNALAVAGNGPRVH